jgi:hypothetical protein
MLQNFSWPKCINVRAGKPYRWGRISMVDLLIKKGCFVKKGKIELEFKN